MHKLWWHGGKWTICPTRSAPRRYPPLAQAAYRSWVKRGMPYNAAGGFFKQKPHGDKDD